MILAAICVALAAVCISIPADPITCYAYTPVTGVINDGPVKVRQSPVDGASITSLRQGTSVTVIDEVAGADGYVWYQIQVSYLDTVTTGYTRSDFITISTEAPPESAVTDGTLAGTTGIVANTDLGVYVRSGAGTVFSALTKVYKGQAVSILGQTSAGGAVWYNVSLTVGSNSYTGWIHGDYVAVNGAVSNNGSAGATTDVSDDGYVAELMNAGFPASYCNSLLALHQKYPGWKFVPVQTGLDFNTVIENESRAGKNLVQSSVNDSRKATTGDAYNWETNVWYGYDGAGWVCASPAYIAYCMDPRNFLNENYIFQFETLEYAPYQTAVGVGNILANTFMAGNYTDRDGQVRSYAETFASVGSSLAVSPYHLASRCKQEQGTKGTSALISGSYSGFDGYYNYFNVGAYTANGASAVDNGLLYARNQGWDTIYKSIAGGSAVVANNYIKKGQNTIYFEKFNVVYASSLYAHQYMTNVMAAMSEGSNMAKAYVDKNQEFVFRIPVYTNMPESAVTFTDSGNPNNWLSSLTVEGNNLTPYFSGSNTSYSLVVGENVSSVNVGATAVAGTSTVSGTGNYSLNYGSNTINVTCISQSGVSRTYTITVARQQPQVTGTPIAVADGASITSAYPIGSYLTGIQPGTSAGSVLAGISAQNCTVNILKPDGTENTGLAGTGDLLTVYVGGAPVRQYEVIVYGDINGDGKISNIDLVLMQKQILGITAQSGCHLEAANTSHDGGVSNRDLVILQKHILNIAPISQ